jgi:hypothetical protein
MDIVRLTRRSLLAAGIMLLALASAMHAQDVTPPKNAATILLHTTLSPEDAYRSVARHLVSRGYGLQTTDGVLFVVTTTFKEAGGAGPTQLTAMVVPDSAGATIRLSGVWRWAIAEQIARGAGETATPIVYGGMGGSPKRKAWEELYQSAASFPDARLDFEVKQ